MEAARKRNKYSETFWDCHLRMALFVDGFCLYLLLYSLWGIHTWSRPPVARHSTHLAHWASLGLGSLLAPPPPSTHISRGAEQPQLLQWLLPNVTSARSTPPVLCVGSVMMVSGDLGHSSNLANMSDDLYLEDFDDTSIFENKVRYILSWYYKQLSF